MNVLSLFDGMSCGQIALERAKIKVDKYFASEIDKNAIIITQKNYPNTIQLGDICKIDGTKLPKIDLLIGGSPCQGFSSAGKELNFNDERSKLIFEYIRLLHETRPTYFLLENVLMKQEWQDIINDLVGVKPILLNSSLVSAQTRRRLYWTNISVNEFIKNKNIKFSDVVGSNQFCGSMRGRRINPITNTRDDYNKKLQIKQYIECRKDDKTNCLTTVDKDNVVTTIKTSRKSIKDIEYRMLTANECEALQTVPKDYTLGVSNNQRKKMLGNGWTVDIIVHIFKGLK